jgi:beta-alanine--pyruvate transaminase
LELAQFTVGLAAVIVEPFSGSAGVVLTPVGYLERLREIYTANKLLLIFDEVIRAFGRCGAITGAEAFFVVPDMINIANRPPTAHSRSASSL